MQTDPPVLDIDFDGSIYSGQTYRDYGASMSDNIYTTIRRNGSFLDNLSDSLQLTAGIFKNLLPLIHISDYEQPVMYLMGNLVDSGFVSPADYESYLPKLILEAKQLLKKQVIQEKNRAIAIAKIRVEEKKNSYGDEGDEADPGNNKLSMYATLLLPFREKNTQVQQIINQLLQSNDKRLKYDAVVQLLRKGHPVHDSLIGEFAAMDEFRYELYTDLKKMNKAVLFPDKFKTQIEIARSRLFSLQKYSKPDTLVFLEKLPLHYKERNGNLYFFKYKEKKTDNNWKLATAGLFPQDSTQVAFSTLGRSKAEEDDFDFTELTNSKLTAESPEKEQLEKLRKKILYSRRKSAAQFYTANSRYGDFDVLRTR
jgi:hypothetical protein